MQKSITIFIFFTFLAGIGQAASILSWSKDILLQPDLRIVYYNLANVTIILIFVSYTCSLFLSRWPKIERPLVASLCIFLFLNIIAIPVHYDTLKKGHLQEAYLVTSSLRQCIIAKDTPLERFAIAGQLREGCYIIRKRLEYGRMLCLSNVPHPTFQCSPS